MYHKLLNARTGSNAAVVGIERVEDKNCPAPPPKFLAIFVLYIYCVQIEQMFASEINSVVFCYRRLVHKTAVIVG